jgi:hypothetical protein
MYVIRKPNDLDRRSIRYKWRKRRFEIIEGILRSVVAARGEVSVIDIGGTRRYWNLLDDPEIAKRCRVTLVNFASWLSEDKSGTCTNGIEFVDQAGDGCDLAGFADGQFDLAHSNSVIEHVGSLSRMSAFAREQRRVGRSYFCQTPYLWFAIEPHHGVPFFHWLPGPTRARLAHRYAVGWRPRADSYAAALTSADNTQLLDAYMLKELFPDGQIHKERTMLLTKSLMAVRIEPQLAAATASDVRSQ